MDMDIKHSDKENVEPTTVSYPALPNTTSTQPDIFTAKSNTHNSPIRERSNRKSPLRDRDQTPPNISRKRQRLASFIRNTPSRPGYTSQVSKIFSTSSGPKLRSPLRVIPLDCHCHSPAHDNGPTSISSDTSSNTKSIYPLLPGFAQHNDDEDDERATPSSSLTNPHREDDKNPLDDLERAITRSFPPTPTREERRKTLHISTPPPQASPSSVSDWTGDEVFFHPIYSRHVQTTMEEDEPGRRNTPVLGIPKAVTDDGKGKAKEDANPPAAPRVMTRRGIGGSRFAHVPVVRSPIAGVPLCMETHPPSLGSDADDEEEEGSSDV